MVTILDFRQSDLVAIMAIQAQCSHAAQWRAEDYAHLIADPEGLLLVAEWRAASDVVPPNHEGASVGIPERVTIESVAGFAAFHRASEEAELRNLAVAPQHQRCGIGRLLLEGGHRRLLEVGVKQVYLEVRSSNAVALSLYSSAGYTVVSVRKGYYSGPEEDACILSKKL